MMLAYLRRNKIYSCANKKKKKIVPNYHSANKNRKNNSTKRNQKAKYQKVV